MNLRTLIIGSLLACLVMAYCRAQGFIPRSFASIGARYSYRVGSGREGGVEISYFPDTYKFPGGITFDMTGGEIKSIHIGAEGYFGIGGIDVGPSYFWNDSLSSFAFSTIVFTGLVLYPFYELDVFEKTTHSFGSHIKFPVTVGEPQR